MGNSEPTWILCHLQFPFGPEYSCYPGWFSFSGIAQDWVARMELTCRFGVSQIVSLDRNPPKPFAWPHYTLKLALFPVIKTVYFKFKQANVFIGAIDHYISLSLHGIFFYVSQRKQSNKHYAYSETKLQCHAKIAILCTLVDAKRYLCIL